MPLTTLRDRRAGDLPSALQVLTGAREQQNADRLRCINALTALVRTHDLGIDARRALTGPQIAAIASWRRREETLGTVTARAEATRLAKPITTLERDLAENRERITHLVETTAPELLDLPGVGAVTAVVILTVWSYPGRICNEAAFAMIAGVCPIPASSGNTTRHRLNRGGDRRLNRAEHHRAHQDAHRSCHPHLHRAAPKRGQDIQRDPTLPQALHQPPNLPITRSCPPRPGRRRRGLTQHRSIPGLVEALIPREDEEHGCTEDVPR